MTGKAARTPAAAGCQSKTRIRLATAGLLASLYRGLIWPRFRRWGATDVELRAPFPGADLIPGSARGGTMAATIDAAPAEVWSWLVQMGCDRAGWYSWDRLDNGGRPSADQIHQEWQHPRALAAIGDLLFWEPALRILQLRQLANLKARAERAHQIAGEVPEPAGDMSPAGVG